MTQSTCRPSHNLPVGTNPLYTATGWLQPLPTSPSRRAYLGDGEPRSNQREHGERDAHQHRQHLLAPWLDSGRQRRVIHPKQPTDNPNRSFEPSLPLSRPPMGWAGLLALT